MHLFLVSPEIHTHLNLILTCPSLHVLFFIPDAAGVTRLQLIVPKNPLQTFRGPLLLALCLQPPDKTLLCHRIFHASGERWWRRGRGQQLGGVGVMAEHGERYQRSPLRHHKGLPWDRK